VNRFKLRRTANRARLGSPATAPPPRAKTSPSIHGDSHFSGLWEHGFTISAGAIHTLGGSIYDLVHIFWQGIGSCGEVWPDFAIPTQHFAKPFLPSQPCLVRLLLASAASASSPLHGCNLSLACCMRICHIVVSFDFLITFQLTFFITHTDHLSFCRF
jgi:hypothetical protein